MANMLMEGDLVSVAYRDKTRFHGIVTAALDEKVLIERSDNACVIEFTCMDGEQWMDETERLARIGVVTIDQFVRRSQVQALAWMFERIEAAMMGVEA